MKTTMRAILLLALLAALAGCIPSSGNGSNGMIVFQSDRDGNYDLYVMNPDGTDVRNLTNHPASDTVPVPSPDGRWIAFQSNRDGNTEIYTIDVISEVQTNLTKNNAPDYSPTWSPDGKQIAFVSERDAVLVNSSRGIWSNNIYIMDVYGSNTRRLTADNKTDGFNGLSWAPDGKRLALNLWAPSPYGGYFPRGINLMSLDNFVLTSLVPEQYTCCAKWSPDGKLIVFSALGESSENIYIMNVDGTGRIAVTMDLSIYNTKPSWSPDGNYIIFSSNRDGDYDIYKIKIDGTNVMQLTNLPGDELSPVWLPEP